MEAFAALYMTDPGREPSDRRIGHLEPLFPGGKVTLDLGIIRDVAGLETAAGDLAKAIDTRFPSVIPTRSSFFGVYGLKGISMRAVVHSRRLTALPQLVGHRIE